MKKSNVMALLSAGLMGLCLLSSCQKEGFKNLANLTIEDIENTKFMEVNLEEVQEMIIGTWHWEGSVKEEGFDDKSGLLHMIFRSDNTLTRDDLSSETDGEYTYEFLNDNEQLMLREINTQSGGGGTFTEIKFKDKDTFILFHHPIPDKTVYQIYYKT